MSTTREAPEIELIELEPTVSLGAIQPSPGAAPTQSQPGAGVVLVEGSIASLTSETETLRRRRLAAAALVLTAAYCVNAVWSLASWLQGSRMAGEAVIWVPMGLRILLAATVLGLLLSPFSATAGRIRALEVALFGGAMAILLAWEYFVNLELTRRDDIPAMVAVTKNGVIQTVILMMIFGTFIPNSPKIVAWAVTAMALSPLFGFAILTENSQVAAAVERAHSGLHVGGDALYLLIGAGIAFAGSLIVNGLRTELHAARSLGQYRLIRKLGAGGMGEVYLAEHCLLKRPCAIKLIRPEAGANPLALARFEREVQSSARLAHHNSIAIYDYGHSDDGTFYYVMEYLSGMSLAELIERHGPMLPGRVIYVFRQICAGLAEAHALGLVHRDLKPSNIYLCTLAGEADVAKILDFGLVKLTREPDAAVLTADFTVSGTPLYMAPEQAAADKSLDGRADIYSLGAVMYHALTGQPPFAGDSPVTIMIAHSRDDVVPPSEVRPGIPQDLETIVLRCLAKKPADRFQNVKELSDALAVCASADEWGARAAEEWWLRESSNPAMAPAREEEMRS
jgi:serine/threonine-protein kinase